MTASPISNHANSSSRSMLLSLLLSCISIGGLNRHTNSALEPFCLNDARLRPALLDHLAAKQPCATKSV